MKKIRVVELFAGVGGFRIALDQASSSKVRYETIWTNQWEPGSVKQHAAEIYASRFGQDGFCNQDIEKVIENDFGSIPDHDMLVGGFPCQDYSVASTLKRAHGLIGKKGVLFWSIYTILKRKGNKAPDYIFLENVDRLLKSPAKQRGKDFAVMLASLSDLGYAVEWRVINAADYGFPQRRRRVYILGYRKGTKLYDQIESNAHKDKWLSESGIFVDAFPIMRGDVSTTKIELKGSAANITKSFSAKSPKISPFENSGVMINRVVITGRVMPDYDGPKILLRDLLEKEKNVPEEFFVDEKKLRDWKYLKGAKKELRKTASGHEYYYSEGSMAFPDALDKPSRTIITGEGGSGASRFKHIIKTKSGRYRRLMPIELERLNMFPDNHTKLDGTSNTKRAFIMGNALVVGVVRKVGESIQRQL